MHSIARQKLLSLPGIANISVMNILLRHSHSAYVHCMLRPCLFEVRTVVYASPSAHSPINTVAYPNFNGATNYAKSKSIATFYSMDILVGAKKVSTSLPPITMFELEMCLLRPGLRPASHWKSSQSSRRPPSWVLGRLGGRKGRGVGRDGSEEGW